MNSINGVTDPSLLAPGPVPQHPVAEATNNFGDMLTSMLSTANEAQLKGDQAIQDLQSGKAKHLHEVMIAVEEADMSLRMLVQMRNRALTAYEEIMRMQI